MARDVPKKEELAKFDSPPVIETVLSLQFSPVSNYSNAHAGWFWKSYLDSDWDVINEVPRLQDQFERFADDRKWGPSGGQIVIQTRPGAERHQILRVDKQRMLQIQNSRFILNWKKGADKYPSYDALKPEFLEYYSNFRKFLNDSGNEEISLNQWEVTYVNQILKGELWETFTDIPTIFPWISFAAESVPDHVVDGYQSDTTLIIGENLGRIHVSLKHARLESEEGPETLVLNLTARGPLNTEEGIDIETALDIGHSSIVRTFDSMISDEAKKAWKRR